MVWLDPDAQVKLHGAVQLLPSTVMVMPVTEVTVIETFPPTRAYRGPPHQAAGHPPPHHRYFLGECRPEVGKKVSVLATDGVFAEHSYRA
jgi:hypothetical protein